MKQDVKIISKALSLSQDQLELLRIHERCNHVISIDDIQLLTAAKNPNLLATCPRQACATYCYGSSHRKSWRDKGHHNNDIIDRMKHVPG